MGNGDTWSIFCVAFNFRKINMKRREKLCLVGYSGKIKYDRRLLPLRVTTKYRRWLEQQESARHEKVVHKYNYQNIRCPISKLSNLIKSKSGSAAIRKFCS
jgi:hypothetical protein